MKSATERFYANLHAGTVEEITMYRSEVHYVLAHLRSDTVSQAVCEAATKMDAGELHQMLYEEGLLPVGEYEFIPRWYARKWLTPKRQSRTDRIKAAKQRELAHDSEGR